jgi:DNA-directed RNA polymerase specialized sigma24 family protein
MRELHGKDRWQLTGETLACLLKALDPQQDAAFERYRRLQQRLIFFFMRHRSAFPEDLADEVINRLARALFEGRTIANLEAFALGVARMVEHEEHARIAREQRSLEEAERNRSAQALTSAESDDDLDIKKAALAALPPAARELLAHYHEADGAARINARQSLAREMGISMGTLRKRVFDLQTAMRNNIHRALNTHAPNPGRKEKSHLQ